MNIVWSLTKIKILGVYIGHGDLAEANWRLRVDAVDRCLKSWRSRSLSYSGKALVANSLALSCVWYVTSLVHMPAWVSAELKKLLFNFFWSGKRDLVARKVLIHPKESGGFSFVSIDFKVAALLIQWVCRLVVCPNGWVYLLTYWLFRFSRDEMRCVPRVFAYLLNVCKYLVWVQRNDFRFLSVPPSPARLVAAIKARLRFYLPLFFKRFLSHRRRLFFVRQWAGNGIFGSISGPSLICSV